MVWELEFCADWKIEVWSASVYRVNLYVCVCLYKSSACLQVGVYVLTACVAAHRTWPWHPASASVYPKTYSAIWSSEDKWGVRHKAGEMVLFTFQREDGVCKYHKSIGWLFQVICRYIFIFIFLMSFTLSLILYNRGSLCHMHHAVCTEADWNSHAREGFPIAGQFRVGFPLFWMPSRLP